MLKRLENTGASEVVSGQFVISNELGLHLRPAGLLVKTANKYASSITVEKEGMQADAKSIIEITSLNAAHNSTITIKACGPDARQAIAALAALITSSFYEPQTDGKKPQEPPA